MNVLNLNNGEKLWDKDIVTKRISYLEDHGDKLLVAHTNGFNFYSYADGKKVWKKDAKGKNIKQVIPVEHDYLYIADNEMNLVDEEGQNKWKKFVEIADDAEDEVFYLGKAGDNRVFYLTSTYGNMVNYVSGKKIWKKNVKFDKKRPLVYATTEDKFVVYNNKRVYTFNNSSKEDPKPKGKVEVENDKMIKSIETQDWGICIVGENDVIGLDYEGNELYHTTYKEPGEAGRRLMKSAGIVGGVMLGVSQGANSSLSTATVTMTYRDSKGQLHSETNALLSDSAQRRASQKADTYGEMGDALEKNFTANVRNRFNAMKQSLDYVFVANRGKQGPELVKVRKKDGEEVVRVPLDGNKPLYEIDPISENLYYASGNVLKIYTK
ncbi:outer membrane protein assembly factor BamB family protein [Myroides pelagicus]|uniref:PQQ-binding-like beta-propeller repeat protein n=1 Tax=Myroides pelagicus TaxID=270914 RepID=A0A7K1GPR7_9FLAO|nr:PQQ-binding-like beta-propeller repeat protein [Myroides pelagicus]MEC4114652.1 PQQ-binding-like beta-propeller repeat protein [Myroides pelagicus]MTH30846.1 PQQ-binding-like beta-propeller repeat protein [Myroides pelagicus]